MHVDRRVGGETVVVHQPDAGVAGGPPHAGVRGHRRAELAGHLEGRALRELGIPGDVEGHLEAEHVVAWRDPARDEVAELGLRRPLPRAGLDVAVGEHEPARDGLERVERSLRVVDRLQVVRPVDRRRHTGVERLDRGQLVARGDVLRAEELAVVEVVPDEVLREGPVCAVAADRGLPHVPVGVDHAGHHDAAGRVDLGRAVRDVERRADGRDPLAFDEDVRVAKHGPGWGHGQHGAVPEDDRCSWPDVHAGVCSHVASRDQSARTLVRHADTRYDAATFGRRSTGCQGSRRWRATGPERRAGDTEPWDDRT